MKRYFITILLIVLSFGSTFSKNIQLSPKAEISVLTCGPSNLVYALYGHTAIRVNDPTKKVDVVFNYGVFSFNAPNFVYRFAKGQTDYMLAYEYYDSFYEDYKEDGRSIYEQVLNLTQSEKQQMFDFLIENAEPENREYRYNFFFDNCASRVRDVVENQIDGTVVFPSDDGENKTFRQHVSKYQKVLPWTNFGIQLALGSPADDIATAYQEMFLPDYLMAHFAKATIKNGDEEKPLVKETNELFVAKEDKSINILTPFVILLILTFYVIYASFNQYKKGTEKYLIDYILLFVTGLIGVAALWFIFYSEHPAMHPNYNVWWAVPLNFPFVFLWMKGKWRPFLKWYWIVLSVWLISFFLFTAFIKQSFHVGFYLIAFMMLIRSLLHSYPVIKAKGERLK